MTLISNPELIQEYTKIVYPNGVLASKRLNEKYFRKYGHGEIYDLIMSTTDFIETEVNLQQRMVFIKEGLTEHPKCVSCGKPVMFVEHTKLSKYCSKPCFYADPNFNENKKTGAAKVDKVAANKKRSETMLSVYGHEFNSKRPEVKAILSESKLKNKNPKALELLNSFEWINENYVVKQRSLVDIAAELGVYYGTVADYCIGYGFDIRSGSNYSLQEAEVRNFVSDLGFSWVSDRTVLGRQEIDILIKEKSFGIEIDGLYWHSYPRFETTSEKNKHLNKTVLAMEKGVKLIHFYDSEWINKQPIVKSMIKSRLGASERIFARECEIVSVDSKEARRFLEENHIQGFVSAKIYIGLKCEENLVMLMSFGKPRFSKNHQWELIRLSSLNGVTVVGGASKLYNYFDKNHRNNESVICYSDRRFGEGEVYKNLGFDFSHSTKIGYSWTDGDEIWHRTNFQKHKLEKILENFDSTKSEAENMFANGYRRIWDCGNNVYEIK